MQPVANIDDNPCCVCRIRLSKSWKAVTCHPVPTKSFPLYYWFCSGPSSGGTENCRKKAKERGARTVIPLGEPRSLYEIVGVKKNATLAQMKRAHKKGVAELLHNFGPTEPYAVRRIKSLDAALKVLKNSESRKVYDQTGRISDVDSFPVAPDSTRKKKKRRCLIDSTPGSSHKDFDSDSDSDDPYDDDEDAVFDGDLVASRVASDRFASKGGGGGRKAGRCNVQPR